MADTPKVYPVHNNKFKVGTDGSTETMVTIANLTNFAPSIEGGVEEWDPMEAEGWGDAMMTSKKLSFSFTEMIGLRVLPGNVEMIRWRLLSGKCLPEQK